MTQKVRFEARDIKTWADLVGDYNPIHFDDSLSRDRGLNGVVVHGMLALLYLKNLVGHEIGRTGDAGEWLRVKARFRVPVLRAADYRIDARESALRTRFNLTHDIDGAVAIDGMMNWGDAPEPGEPSYIFEVPEGGYEDLLRRYKKAFPEMNLAWLFLDCLLFEILLKNEILFRFIKELGLDKGCDSQLQLMDMFFTVQSSHLLHVRADLLKIHLDELHELLPLKCMALSPTISAPDSDSRFVALCPLQLHSGGALLLQSDVGLVVGLRDGGMI